MRNSFYLMALASVFYLLASFTLQGEWVRLGSRLVNYGLDRDVIQVNKHKEGFKALKLDVKRGALNLHKVEVFFENGGSQEIETRHTFRRGSESRVIDLNGNGRRIDRITLWYDTKNVARNRAMITVFGRR